MSEVYQVTHLVPISISLSRFESTAIGNGVDVSDGSENLPSKDLTALSVRILLDGLSFDMVMVKRERRNEWRYPFPRRPTLSHWNQYAYGLNFVQHNLLSIL